MKIAIYIRSFSEENKHIIEKIFKKIDELKAQVMIYEPFFNSVKDEVKIKREVETFSSSNDINNAVDYLVSIGGDGTLLETTTLVRDSGIPIIGINTGRLGFLSSIDLSEVDEAIDQVFRGEYTLEKRTLLKVETANDLFGQENFALNEMTVQKRDTSSMITIHAYMNGEFLNSYWADGLIIATPTGSTAYSLSCGGPIILPGSNNFEITPISPHNLNVRPLIVPDNKIITLQIEGRNKEFLVSLDSRSKIIDDSIELRVSKNNFHLNLLRLKNQNHLATMRSKLNWGLDQRN